MELELGSVGSRGRFLEVASSEPEQGRGQDQELDLELEQQEDGDDDSAHDQTPSLLTEAWSPATIASSSGTSSSPSPSPSPSSNLPLLYLFRLACTYTTALVTELPWTILGISLAGLGIAAFALQERAGNEGYYAAHSLWHLFVMASSFPLLKGRRAAVGWIARMLGVDVSATV